MIILDTFAYIDYLNGDEQIKNILSEQESLFILTSITIYEVNFGLERTKRIITKNIKHFEMIEGIEIIPN